MWELKPGVISRFTMREYRGSDIAGLGKACQSWGPRDAGVSKLEERGSDHYKISGTTGDKK